MKFATNCTKGSWVILAFLALSVGAFGQKNNQIALSTGQLTLQPLTSSWQVTDSLYNPLQFGEIPLVVQFAQSLSTQIFTQKTGLVLVQKLASNTWLAYAYRPLEQLWLLNMGVVAISSVAHLPKLSTALKSNIWPRHAIIGQACKVWIQPIPNYTNLQLTQYLLQKGYTVTPTQNIASPKPVEALVTRADLAKLEKEPYILYIEPIPAPDRILNQGSRTQGQASFLNTTGGTSLGLSGKNVVIGVGDDADPTLHPDFSNRIINQTGGIVNDHGAHVTGTTAGAGIMIPERAGFAPKATVISQWFSGIWLNAYNYVDKYDMVLTNNSYGNIVGECEKAGLYDLQSNLLDAQASSFPSLLHVFASGNDGDFTCSPFPLHYATVLGGMQSAKNIITVGRTDYPQLSSGSSSSGPVKDGRIKPEITALGEAINSARGNYTTGNQYFQDWGTSMSAPAITGGLALLYEHYKNLHSQVNPTGALMKAILLNGARDIGSPGPDYRHGFGFMHLVNSARMITNNTYFEAVISHSQVQDKIVNVTGSPSQLKVMLYWHDVAASPLSLQTLVNDLDLELISPSGTTSYPLHPNPSGAQVADAAIASPDHINNVEQITIYNPEIGNYTLRVHGHSILGSPLQTYALVYDTLSAALSFTTPAGNQSFTSGSMVPISWNDDASITGTYTIAYNNGIGGGWINIATGLKDTTRYFQWTPPASLATSNAQMRITKTSIAEPGVSEPFNLINAPNKTNPPADQCPGYIRLTWTAVTGATAYEVLKNIGGEMIAIDTLTSATLNYLYTGLNPDSNYQVAVRAMINGQSGVYRSALNVKPNTGGCSLAIYNGDLALDSVMNPSSGRTFTPTALTAATTVKVRIKNRDNAAVNAFEIKYSINGSPYVIEANTSILPANGSYTHDFVGLDFSAIGTYNIVAVVHNLDATDPNNLNDTFKLTVRQLPNTPLDLSSPFEDGFETLASIITLDKTLGVAGSDRWDYVNYDKYGRLRTNITPNIPHNGTRAVTLDVSKAGGYVGNPTNHLLGTFNLSNYTISNPDIRLDFNWQMHGAGQLQQDSNKVWVRGSYSQPWVELYDLSANQTNFPIGYILSPSLSITKVLLAAGQSLTSSTQVKWGQYAFFGMADATHFAGYTFDDLTLQIATNDVQLTHFNNPAAHECGLTATTPIEIAVYNSATVNLINVPVRYRVNGLPWVNEIIPIIYAESTLNYPFATTANLSTTATYTIEAQVMAVGDNIPQNDTLSILIRNQPQITNFPYLQNFETGQGGWYSGGYNSSWQYGTPASHLINAAASGTKAWKTTLVGNYLDNELSYLYSPCFNLTGMDNPTLSFSMAYDMEDCRQYGVVCDATWVEYSTDGQIWQKLGIAGSGTNWYDNSNAQTWTLRNQTWWHVATTTLPVVSGNIQLRFVMSSDDGVGREGIALDDIHIYNLEHPIYTVQPTSDSLVNTLIPGQWVNYTMGSDIVAAIKTNSLATSVGIKAYISNGEIRSENNGYYSHRNLTINATTPLGAMQTADVRLYFTDAEVNDMRVANSCSTCTTIKDYTKLKVQSYNKPGQEDGRLDNNSGGIFSSIAAANTQFVPYDIGYYAQFNTNHFSEWWLTNGDDKASVLASSWVYFKAALSNNTPILSWQVSNEEQVLLYDIQVSAGNTNNFISLGTVAAQNVSLASYNYTDLRNNLKGIYYYRIVQVSAGVQTNISPIKAVQIGAQEAIVKVFPNPASQWLYITANQAPFTHASISLQDSKGSVVYHQSAFVLGVSALKIPLFGLSSGWYMLLVAGNDGTTVTQKVWVK